MEANAAIRSIVRREDGAGWQAMLGELARTSGIATPTTDQLRQFDRTRKGRPRARSGDDRDKHRFGHNRHHHRHAQRRRFGNGLLDERDCGHWR
jgi:hypothetical protein